MYLVKVENLHINFPVSQGVVQAVRGFSCEIKRGETLALVGESGCGKSTTAKALMKLLTSSAKIPQGKILFNDTDLLDKEDKYMEGVRGKDISMIFQEPMTSLNPVYKVGDQIAESIRIHLNLGKKQAMKKAIDMMKEVGIANAEKRANQYPHQMSGGMRQRAMIAMALACQPQLLIADEPTTALDVTIQAQILRLMKGLQTKFNTAILFITHELGVVAQMADRVAVMYLGTVVEEAPVKDIFYRPLHPYTKGLLKSVPSISQKVDRIPQIAGSVPNIKNLPTGCPFHPRCELATDKCRKNRPILEANTSNHMVACFYTEINKGD